VGVVAFLAGFSAPRELQPIVHLMYFVVLDGFLLTLGLAILKYRLCAIDLVINKTLVYGALAVLIASVYVAFVVGLGADRSAWRAKPDPGVRGHSGAGGGLRAAAAARAAGG
jgi:hypothetical protein